MNLTPEKVIHLNNNHSQLFSSGTTCYGAKILLGNCSKSRTRNVSFHRVDYDSLNNDLIRSVCARGLGLNPTGVYPVLGGKRSLLYRIEAENSDYFALKIFNINDHHGPGHELLFAGIVGLQTQDVPVLKIIMIDVSGEILAYPYSFSSWLRGDSVKNHVSAGLFSGSEKIFEDMGQILGHIHSVVVPMKGFGVVTVDCIRDFFLPGKTSGTVLGEYGTAAERYIRPVRRKASYLLRNAVIDRSVYDNIMSVLNGGVPGDDDIVFQHGDVSMGNFLTDGTSITGILDGSGMIGFRHDEISALYLSLHALEFFFPRFNARKAFKGFIRGYHISTGKEILCEQFTFFCVTNTVEHLSILAKKGRQQYISRFVKFLHSMLNWHVNPITFNEGVFDDTISK